MFAIWLAYGLFQWQRSGKIRDALSQVCRKRKMLWGPLLLLAGVAVMAGCLVLVQSAGGITPKGMAPWAFAFLTVGGLAFLHLQVMGAAMMVSLAVTGECAASSCRCGTGVPSE